MKIITETPKYFHVSLDTVAEFEQAIISDTRDPAVPVPSLRFLSQVSHALWKRCYASNPLLRPFQQPRYENVKSETSGTVAILMGPDFLKCFPRFLLPGRKCVYLFDAWPESHEKIIRYANGLGLSHLFLSSSQSVEMLQSGMIKTRCVWIPEAIDPALYAPASYHDKDIDVLALGRRYDTYHENIVDALEKEEKIYLYEKRKGEIIFPTRKELIDGLARTKISICVPSSVTHPDRAGGIETMTVRYLQSMASKCLILGHAPVEMINLFGYNPILEIDWNDPVQQIRSILRHFPDYIPFIEKNYAIVTEEHTWRERWKRMHLSIVSNS